MLCTFQVRCAAPYTTSTFQGDVPKIQIQIQIQEDCLTLLNKIALLFLYTYGRVKYAYVVLLFLAKLHAILPTGMAFELIHNRFFSATGKAGDNIPLHLSENDQEEIYSDLVPLVYREIVKYMPCYAPFKSGVQHHIPHPHSKEMSQKSDQN